MINYKHIVTIFPLRDQFLRITAKSQQVRTSFTYTRVLNTNVELVVGRKNASELDNINIAKTWLT
jgi:hypothetical protein